MNRLRSRVSAQPQASAAGMSGGQASPGGTPQVMPVAQVTVSAPRSGYVTAGYRLPAPLWTADGAAVPATAPGRWGQLAAAGRP